MKKLAHAINGNNGLWLCNNHHKLLDTHIIRLFDDNSVKHKVTLSERQSNYLNEVTTVRELSEGIINPEFSQYLILRNEHIPEEEYVDFAS